MSYLAFGHSNGSTARSWLTEGATATDKDARVESDCMPLFKILPCGWRLANILTFYKQKSERKGKETRFNDSMKNLG